MKSFIFVLIPSAQRDRILLNFFENFWNLMRKGKETQFYSLYKLGLKHELLDCHFVTERGLLVKVETARNKYKGLLGGLASSLFGGAENEGSLVILQQDIKDIWIFNLLFERAYSSPVTLQFRHFNEKQAAHVLRIR